MVAAAKSARGSRTRIEVIDDPAKLGITAEELAQLHDAIKATIDWLREHA